MAIYIIIYVHIDRYGYKHLHGIDRCRYILCKSFWMFRRCLSILSWVLGRRRIILVPNIGGRSLMAPVKLEGALAICQNILSEWNTPKLFHTGRCWQKELLPQNCPHLSLNHHPQKRIASRYSKITPSGSVGHIILILNAQRAYAPETQQPDGLKRAKWHTVMQNKEVFPIKMAIACTMIGPNDLLKPHLSLKKKCWKPVFVYVWRWLKLLESHIIPWLLSENEIQTCFKPNWCPKRMKALAWPCPVAWQYSL